MHTLIAPVRVQGQLMRARIIVKEVAHSSGKYYTHELGAIKMLPGHEASTKPASGKRTEANRAASTLSVADLLRGASREGGFLFEPPDDPARYSL